MSAIQKHKILKLLLKVYNDNSYTTSNTTEAGKTMSVEDIHRKTGYNIDTVKLLIGALHYNDYIKKFNLVGKDGIDFWGITDKGRNAISENRFVWYKNYKYWTEFIAILISLAALLVAILKD